MARRFSVREFVAFRKKVRSLDDCNTMKQSAARMQKRFALCGGLCLALCAGTTLAGDGPAALKAEKEPGGKQGGGRKIPAPIAGTVESSYLGLNYSYNGPSNNSRFLAARLVVRNSSSGPIVLKAKDILLRVDESDLRLKDLAVGLRNQTIQAGLKTVDLSKLKLLADLKVPPQGSESKWLVFTGIPAGLQIPKMVLRLRLGEKPLEVDVNDAARQIMGLQVER